MLNRLGGFLRYWLPVVTLAGLIFMASTDAGSVRHTSRIIGPLLRWLVPGVTEEAIQTVQLGIRKCAHGTEYAVLAGLIWRALYRPTRSMLRPWSGAQAMQAWLGATVYAVSDEFHQSFVPSRQGSGWDVLIDSIGAALALWLLHRVGRYCRWWT